MSKKRVNTERMVCEKKEASVVYIAYRLSFEILAMEGNYDMPYHTWVDQVCHGLYVVTIDSDSRLEFTVFDRSVITGSSEDKSKKNWNPAVLSVKIGEPMLGDTLVPISDKLSCGQILQLDRLARLMGIDFLPSEPITGCIHWVTYHYPNAGVNKDSLHCSVSADKLPEASHTLRKSFTFTGIEDYTARQVRLGDLVRLGTEFADDIAEYVKLRGDIPATTAG